jgi:hypothetical protein
MRDDVDRASGDHRSVRYQSIVLEPVADQYFARSAIVRNAIRTHVAQLGCFESLREDRRDGFGRNA